MDLTDQTNAIQSFGYSHREAAFIAIAALHSGYFLRRQFSPNRGKRADDLCRKLLRNEHARSTVYAQNTQLFHLFAKPLYCALGQEDNRHRRPQDPFSLRSKLMGLDYVITHPELRFLPTEQSKLQYFLRERNTPQTLLPGKMYTSKSGAATTARYFVEKYPVWVDPQTGRVGFGYMDDGLFTPPSFLTWLRQHGALFAQIGAVDVAYISVSSSPFTAAANSWARTFGTVSKVLPAELQAYFELRSDIDARGLAGRTQDTLDRYRKLTRRFAESKFHEQYEAWKSGLQLFQTGGLSRQQGHAEPTFSTLHLRHSYRMFGSLNSAKNGRDEGVAQ